MIKSVEEYLDVLKVELKDGDVATVQDALADAEEHLRAALTNLREKQPEVSDDEALVEVIEQYGTPEETASAYREVERRTVPVPMQKNYVQQGAIRLFFGVYDDPKAWGSLLYMLISMITGIVYFTWVVTGLSLSLSFAIFIFGLLFAVFFTVSLRGLALMEGRIVEGLLGVRMPRRSLFFQKGSIGWFERLKTNLTDKHMWLALVYFFLQMPLGVIYFSIVITLFTLSVGLMAAPLVQSIMDFPILSIGVMRYYLPAWSTPLFLLLGFLIWTLTMHLARFIGQWHGRYAKTFLVTE